MVAVLALGVGANTAVFSVVKTVLLDPLPYEDSGRLLRLVEARDEDGGTPRMYHGVEFYRQLREMGNDVVEVAAYLPRTLALSGGDKAERVNGLGISPELLPLLRVAPVLGRGFTELEAESGNDGVVVVSHRIWRQRFGAQNDVLGQSVFLDGASHTVVGVLPPGFRFLDSRCDVLTPLVLTDPRRAGGRPLRSVPILARLADGVTVQQAEAEANSVLHGLRETGPPIYAALHTGTVRFEPLKERMVSGYRTELWLLQGAVALVLVIVCSNLATLHLAGALSRTKELAIRTALGCGRARLFGQLLVEAILIAVAGGAVGCLLAIWGTGALISMSPADVPRLDQVRVDGQVLAFSLALSLMTGAVFGMWPALRASRLDTRDALSEGGSAGSGRKQHRVRMVLVASQVALAVTLAIGAGLLVNSLVRLMDVDPGFNPDHVLTMQVDLPPSRYSDEASHVAFYDELLEAAGSIPDVECVGIANALPFHPTGVAGGFLIDGKPVSQDDNDVPMSRFQIVSSEYFAAMGMSLIRGRPLNQRTVNELGSVVAINQTLARQYFPGEDPLGQRLLLGRENEAFEVVGIVRDVKHEGLGAETEPTVFVPYQRLPQFFENKRLLLGIFLAARTKGDPLRAAPALNDAVASIDPDLPAFDVLSMDRRVSDSLVRPRFYASFLGAFSGLAVALAVAGLYGVATNFVRNRIREIGVRMALGASTADVARLVVGKGMQATLIGICLGLAGAWSLTRFLSRLLFGIGHADPATFAAIATLMLVVAGFALFVPARQATRVDPMQVLREE
jgi:predicted permease